MKSNFYNAQVMMIDDSPESIEIAANILKKVDYQLKVAINAKIARSEERRVGKECRL